MPEIPSPVVWVLFSWLIQKDVHRGPRNQGEKCFSFLKLSVQVLRTSWAWSLACFSFPICLDVMYKPSTGEILVILPAQPVSLPPSETLRLGLTELTVPACCLLPALAATKVAGTIQMLRLGEPPCLPHNKDANRGFIQHVITWSANNRG